ncbi:MAG: hypothetical protein FE048_04755 [Thermoplasmata archaeon]|nr:MAG: hypothetical protein FE048_04755 [Thermoplasmata archaeon]
MKKILVILLAFMLFFPMIYVKGGKDSYIHIVEPEGGLYIYGKKILPEFNPFWTVIIGQSFINVRAEASNDILLSYFTLQDVMKREIVQGVWDKDKSDGFSCSFTNIQNGVYLIAVIALALDPNEPVAWDWRAPVAILVQ